MNRAFTIIELIFVIVILGILAAIVTPKLVATRDDALVAKTATDLTTIIMEVGTYYTSHNSFKDNLKEMTYVSLTSDNQLTIKDQKCLKFVLVDTNGILRVELGDNHSSEICSKFLSISSVAANVKEHRFGGHKIGLE